MIASANRSIEVVRELIENGADINAKGNDKRRRDKDGQHYTQQVIMDI